MKHRAILAADLWAAMRGLEMHQKTDAELLKLIENYSTRAEFAAAVIVQAARQVLAPRTFIGG